MTLPEYIRAFYMHGVPPSSFATASPMESSINDYQMFHNSQNVRPSNNGNNVKQQHLSLKQESLMGQQRQITPRNAENARPEQPILESVPAAIEPNQGISSCIIYYYIVHRDHIGMCATA